MKKQLQVPSAETGKPPCRGLLRRRTILIPTWRGWLLLGLVLALFALLFANTIHPFLALNRPVPGGALVVEGWAPDYVMEQAVAEFKRNPYTKLYVTGGPLEKGRPLSEYKTYAELGEAVVLKLGLSREVVQAVPAPKAPKDRTYQAAVSLRKYLARQTNAPTAYNLVTLGAHARRSRLLFGKVFGHDARVGVIAVVDENYEPGRWWKTSYGVRGVVNEFVGYLYARFLFWPKPET